jgi:hypothetical protein
MALGAIGFLAYLAVVLLLMRLARNVAPAVLVVGTAALMSAVTVMGAMLVSKVVLVWPLMACYWLLALGFLLAFGAVYKSVSLRIIGDLVGRPSRSDRYEAILERYIEEESYRSRLAVLLGEGLAVREGSGFRLTDQGRRIARVVDGVQRLFNIRHSG